jgi:hypothetical protein
MKNIKLVKNIIPFTLRAPSGKKIKGTIEIGERMLMIGLQGYGEHSAIKGQGTPIVIEYHDHNGVELPQVHVFADINKDDPTHSISLSGAKESLRIED